MEVSRAVPDLRTIVYVSTATRLLSVAQLETLLTRARNLNLQNAVTGALLYSDGNFMQCLEGPLQAMRETYERIRSSRQHTDIRELLNQQISVRGFADWQMEFSQVTQSELLTLSAWFRSGFHFRNRLGAAMDPVAFSKGRGSFSTV